MDPKDFPAFPVLEQGGDGRLELGDPGMTLLDYFAAQALPAVISTPESWRDLGFKPVNGKSNMENNALCAYQQAEAMLKARAA